MRLLFTASLLILCMATTAQKKTITVVEDKIGGITCSVQSTINLLSKDTTTSVVLTFQNAKYSSITDIGVILFMEPDAYTIKDFIDDLKMAEKEMEEKQSIEWERDLYTLNIYDFNKGKLYVETSSKHVRKYTTINKKQVAKLIEWMQNNALK